MSSQKSARELNQIISELEIARVDAIDAVESFVSDSMDIVTPSPERKTFEIKRYRELQEKVDELTNQIEMRRMMVVMR